MNVAIVSIGDELIDGASSDTNGPWLAGRLLSGGASVFERRVVGDDRADIAAAITALADRSDAILLTGGLGPTADDLTRFALADALCPGTELVRDATAVAQLESFFRGRGRTMPESNLVQALRPATMRFLPNPHGTAMGLAGSLGSCLVFSLPGPPHEMQPMFADHVGGVLPWPRGAPVRRSLLVHACGLGESAAAELLGDILDRGRRPLVGITVSDAIVTARINAVGPASEAEAALRTTRRGILDRWQPYAFGEGEQTLASAAGVLIAEGGLTLATAESSSGGLLGSSIVEVAGCSQWYRGGWVTYSDDLKRGSLGVPAAMLAAHGAVSGPVASAMAEGARAAAGASAAISITGIAGPSGGTPSKPVGTVFVGLARDGRPPEVRRFVFPGGRSMVRSRSVKSALQMLRFSLLGVSSQAKLLWEQP